MLESVAPHSIQAREELEELESVPLPSAAEYIWSIFLELSAHRTSGGFGPTPLSWQDLDAWQRVTKEPITARERAWVFELDRLFLEDAIAEIEKKRTRR